MPSDIPSKLKVQIRALAEGRCEYCRVPQSHSDFHDVDHIQPRSKGGASALANLALCCGRCNVYKYNRVEWRDPLTQEVVLLFHPRNDRWSDHFRFVETADHQKLLIEGLTPQGRATVDALRLNREGRANLRALLDRLGLLR